MSILKLCYIRVNELIELSKEGLQTTPVPLPYPSAWVGHIPFGIALVKLVNPSVLVELGTHYGHSYFAFCHSIAQNQLPTSAYAVDTWKGDLHAGCYGEEVFASVEERNKCLYENFSTLLHMEFDEAAEYFANDTIDFLHIDGLHTYEAVKHDFEKWLPKLSNRGVVLIHDINVREKGFGTWEFWAEISTKYASLSFRHSSGLGVLFVGEEKNQACLELLSAWENAKRKSYIQLMFERLGGAYERESELYRLKKYINEVHSNSSDLANRNAENEMIISGLRERNDAWRSEQLELLDRLQGMTVQLSDMEKSNIKLRQSIDDELQLKGLLNSHAESLENEVIQTRTTNEALVRELASQKEVFDSILHSQSWMLTAPLRWGGLTVRRLIQWKTRAAVASTNAGGMLPLAKKASVILREEGIGGIISRSNASGEMSGTSNLLRAQSTGSTTQVENLLRARFQMLTPLSIYSAPDENQYRINLVTDSINAGSLFGGVGTSIIFAAVLANSKKANLRIITRAERANEANVLHVLRENGIDVFGKLEFEFCPRNSKADEIGIIDRDVFITTSWWTTLSVMKSVRNDRIIYLLQEDERMFYPFDDMRLRCDEVLKSEKIKFVINTRLLYDHLLNTGLTNLHGIGVPFEPSFSAKTFYPEKRGEMDRKQFFFYARPNNDRNLFYLGLEVINKAIMLNIIDTNEWDIVFVGKDIPEISFTNGVKPHIHEALSWSEYGGVVRKVDLGLSLMYTPHPSYPPFDLVASGSVVVTNQFEIKTDLSQYSDNLICVPLSVEGLLSGLRDGVDLACDIDTRSENFAKSNILRDWISSFEGVLNFLEEAL